VRVAVIGAGPAGTAAAVFLKRYGVRVDLFEKDQVGGLIANAWRIENIPFIDPCPGEKIVEILQENLRKFSIEIIHEEVLEVRDRILRTKSFEREYDRIIVASGTVPKRIIDFEVCERVVYEFKHLPKGIDSLAIYGAGDAAFDGALKAIEQGVKNVHIFNKSRVIKALPRLVELVKCSPIIYHENEPMIEVKHERNLTVVTNKGSYCFDAILICIGRSPNVSFVIERTKNVHIVGDAAGGFRQMSIAVGQAVEACMRMVGER